MRKNREDANLLKRVAMQTVRALEPETGSRMLAYEKLATAIGVSASWLRKFITVQGTPEPRWSVGHELVTYYQKLCDRVGDDVSEQRREIRKLIGEINEADPLAGRFLLPVSLAKHLGFGADD